MEREVVVGAFSDGDGSDDGVTGMHRILLRWGEVEKVIQWAEKCKGYAEGAEVGGLKGKRRKIWARKVLDVVIVAFPAVIMSRDMDGEVRGILKACKFEFNSVEGINVWWDGLDVNKDHFTKNTTFCIILLLLALTTPDVENTDVEKYLDAISEEVVQGFDSDFSTTLHGGSRSVVNLVARAYEKVGNYPLACTFGLLGVKRTLTDGTIVPGHAKPAVEADCLCLLGRCVKREGKEVEAIRYFERAEKTAARGKCM